MDNSQIVVGVPILLMAAMLLLLGASWLMRHHRLRPLAGIVLFALGVAFFWRVALIKQPDSAWRKPIRAQRSATATSTTGSTSVSFSANAERDSADDGTVTSAPSDAPSLAIPDPDASTAEPRPDWVNRPPHSEKRGDGSRVFVMTVASGRYSTPAECERAIVPAVNAVVARYIDQYMPENTGEPIRLDAAAISAHFVTAWYWARVDASVGPMYELHGLLVFDRHVRDDLKSRVREATIDGRLKYTAGGTALALLLLGGVYGLLKRGV